MILVIASELDDGSPQGITVYGPFATQEDGDMFAVRLYEANDTFAQSQGGYPGDVKVFDTDDATALTDPAEMLDEWAEWDSEDATEQMGGEQLIAVNPSEGTPVPPPV